MSKPKRGKNIKAMTDWRGTCPECRRTGVKLLWAKVSENNTQLKVCKHCGQ